MTLQPTKVLRQHVYDLARAFDVRVVETDMPPDKAGANVQHRLVFIGNIIDETTYAVALHELGHLISPTGALHDGGPRASHGLTLHEEESAWTWARHYALDWTPAMEYVAQWALSTYTQRTDTTGPLPPSAEHIDWSDY
jgi:hypothetical protein